MPPDSIPWFKFCSCSVAQSSGFGVVFCRSMFCSFSPFYFCHCIVCPSSIYSFWSTFCWYLQTYSAVILPCLIQQAYLLNRCMVECLENIEFWSPITTAPNKEHIARVGVLVFNDTFNNISIISWRSVLLLDETGIPGENHPPTASQWQTLSPSVGFELTTLVVIYSDCIGSCESNWQTITMDPTRCWFTGVYAAGQR